MVDLRGKRGIDARKRFAGRNAGRSGGENLTVIRVRRGRFFDVIPRQDLLADFGDKPV
jgi:hypothetical protein